VGFYSYGNFPKSSFALCAALTFVVLEMDEKEKIVTELWQLQAVLLFVPKSLYDSSKILFCQN
jgi:hypothetical protein